MGTKIFFTDLDGTLLDDDKNVSAGNQAAIDTALAEGHKIVISTGRPLSSAKTLAKNLGLVKKGCYVICYNGAVVYDSYKDEIIYGNPLDEALATEIYEKARSIQLHIHSYSATQVLTLRESPELFYYCEKTKMSYKVIPNLKEAFPYPPYKLIAVDIGDHKKINAFYQMLQEKYASKVNFFFSGEHYVEVVPKGIDKGAAVRWLCDYLGISIENSVGAGDAENDIAMLEACHVGAVMVNALPAIKEHGNYVTERDNNHDGAAEIIEKFILNS